MYVQVIRNNWLNIEFGTVVIHGTVDGYVDNIDGCTNLILVVHSTILLYLIYIAQYKHNVLYKMEQIGHWTLKRNKFYHRSIYFKTSPLVSTFCIMFFIYFTNHPGNTNFPIKCDLLLENFVTLYYSITGLMALCSNFLYLSNWHKFASNRILIFHYSFKVSYRNVRDLYCWKNRYLLHFKLHNGVMLDKINLTASVKLTSYTLQIYCMLTYIEEFF